MQAICAGIDEVGRGALAGPVVVGAILLPPNPGQVMADLREVLRRVPADSKKLTRLQRERAAAWLGENFTTGCGFATAAEINNQGLSVALKLAAGRALAALSANPQRVFADAGLFHPYEETMPTERFIKGDERIPAILCASIIAKVARDRHMIGLASYHPCYDWEQNKGYGTATHCRAIREHGASNEHRQLFIRNLRVDGANLA